MANQTAGSVMGAAHHLCHPELRDDKGTCKICCCFETLLLFLYAVVTRSSPDSRMTAAGGSTFGSHIPVVPRQHFDCAFSYCRSRSCFKRTSLIRADARASSNLKKSLLLCSLCSC
jgi:hypothetical protein